MKIVVVFVAVAALLGGCGVHLGKPAPEASPANGVADLAAWEIMSRAQDALKAATSFRVRGALYHGTLYNRPGTDPQLWSFDMRLAGADAGGWTAIGASKQETVTVGGKHWIRPSEQILAQTMGGEPARRFYGAMKGRWTAVAPDEEVFGDFVTTEFVVNLLLPPGGNATRGEAKVVNGVPAIAVSMGAVTVYVATSGEPYPLRMDRSQLEVLTFAEFGGATPEIRAPAPADVVDFSGTTSKPA
ncbi:hypothetical protein [Actinoplanes sp. HUAS TT8]|uniref:hypothetical protein n=1 Tax=Actinoplanes sp. HUAS TT8 TaxID=3447453 RepID=UPI003F528E88